MIAALRARFEYKSIEGLDMINNKMVSVYTVTGLHNALSISLLKD